MERKLFGGKDLKCFIFIFLVQAINCLRISKFLVPDSALTGEDVHLGCEYDLEGESLYTLKWYKDETEFFRIEPKARSEPQYFTVPGIQVDRKSSNGTTVILKSVDKLTTGTITCEVSAEGSFQTVVDEQNFTVLSSEEGYLNSGPSKWRPSRTSSTTCSKFIISAFYFLLIVSTQLQLI